jgi:hypothetical protein
MRKLPTLPLPAAVAGLSARNIACRGRQAPRCDNRRPIPQGRPVDLKVKIALTVERSEEIANATAELDLASGEIRRVEYTDWDVDTQGQPWDAEDYEFTSGMLSHQGKDVEFGVELHPTTGQFSVNANELLEIKLKAAQLFAGLTGADLIANAKARKG